MKHVRNASPPYLEIAPGLRVTYLRCEDGSPYTYDDEPFRVLVDGVEVGAYCVVESPVKEAGRFATMLQAVYDKGRDEEFKNRDAVYAMAYDKGSKDARRTDAGSKSS